MELLYAHNKTVYQNLKPGDRVQFKRGIYSHWALAIGHGKVIHFCGESIDLVNGNSTQTSNCLFGHKAIVKVDDFWDVVNISKAYINNSLDKKYTPLDIGRIFDIAKYLLGQENYDVFTNNCEHFVNLCRYGKKKSTMVENFFTAAAVGTGVVMFGALALLSVLPDSNQRRQRRNED